MTDCFLVTGGNGYIGSHMCQFLHSLNKDVVVIDSHVTSPSHPVHSYAQFYQGDVGDADFVKKVLDRHSIKAVFHFAARSIVSESEARPFEYLRDNTQKSVSFFESLVQAGIRHLIFSSTSSVYGTNMELQALSETAPVRPENAYALSKKLVEDSLFYLSKRYRLSVGILRYFNVAGNDPQLAIGENHEPETHLIPNLCLSHLAGRESNFKLYGDTHPTPDGTCIRDYIHVCDLVRAHWLCYENLKDTTGCEIFNLGSGRGFSVLEVLTEFENVIGKRLNYDIVDSRPGDPPRLVCDIQKAVSALNFKNEFGLRQCIEHTLGYLKKAAAPASN